MHASLGRGEEHRKMGRVGCSNGHVMQHPLVTVNSGRWEFRLFEAKDSVTKQHFMCQLQVAE